MKIQYKIALLFSILCTSIIIVLSCAIYYFAYERAFQDFFTRLELRANIAARANLPDDNTDAKTYETVRKQHLQQLPDEKEYILRQDTLQQFLQTTTAKQLPAIFFSDVLSLKKAAYRKDYRFYQAINYVNKKSSFIIIISAENTYAKNFLSTLRNILLVACLISMVIVFSMGILFSEQILQPLRKITRDVKAINATSLHKRLTQKQGKDEIADLTQTFNDMISRLETAFETQHNFVSNASHELNTPLTAIIGEADLALSKPLTEEKYQQSIASILIQAERLRDITKGLLELASSGFIENFSMEKVRIDEVIYNVQKIANDVYPKAKLQVDYSLYPDDANKLLVLANGNLVELAISNIVLNACKYSLGKHVIIALAASNSEVIIIVKDTGIGIPDKDMVHVFDPFFRASNTQGTKGYGIGLPLTMNIVKMHNGSITINSKVNQGTEVVVKLPMYIAKSTETSTL